MAEDVPPTGAGARGSGAAARASPVRGRDGRFRATGRRPARPRRLHARPGVLASRAGVRGPSWLFRKEQRMLARHLVELECRVARLEAECEGVAWSAPARSTLARMAAIDENRKSGVARRLAALDDVLIDRALARRSIREEPGAHVVLAEAMSARLGEPVGWRSLYNHPYVTRWRDGVEALGLHPAENVATFCDRARMAKRLLVHRILRSGERFDVLTARRRAELVAASETDGDDWSVIR